MVHDNIVELVNFRGVIYLQILLYPQNLTLKNFRHFALPVLKKTSEINPVKQFFQGLTRKASKARWTAFVVIIDLVGQ